MYNEYFCCNVSGQNTKFTLKCYLFLILDQQKTFDYKDIKQKDRNGVVDVNFLYKITCGISDEEEDEGEVNKTEQWILDYFGI